MESFSNQMPYSPHFTINPETFSLDSSRFFNMHLKRNTSPLLTSPFCLNKQQSTEISKDNITYGQMSFISHGDANLLSFRDTKASPFFHNTHESYQTLNDQNLTYSFDNNVTSRNKRLSIQQIDMKDNSISIHRSKYSSKYQGDQTIKEEPNEDSFNNKKNKEIQSMNCLNKDNSLTESKRMIIEMIKIFNPNDAIIDKYQIDLNTFIPYYLLRGNCGVSNKKMQSFKLNENATCSTKENYDDFDQATKIICFLSIPRIIYFGKDKRLICISPCRNIVNRSNDECYCLSFRNVGSMKLIEKISIKSITACHKKSNKIFVIEFIHTKTFIKKKYDIETQSEEDCTKYVAGINAFI